MIYDTLDTLPVLTFYKVGSTSNLGLLQNKIKRKNRLTEIQLIELFTKLQEKFTEGLNKLNHDSSDEVRFIAIREYEKLNVKQNGVFMAIELLKIEVNEDAIDYLTTEGFIVDLSNTVNYYKSLENITRRANTINAQKNQLRQSVPKVKEYADSKENPSEETENDISQIIKTLIAFSEILNVQINIQKVSCAEYLVYYDLVRKKIEQEKKNNQNAKKE